LTAGASQPRGGTEVYIPQISSDVGMVPDQAEIQNTPMLRFSERTNNAISAGGISTADEDMTQKAVRPERCLVSPK
jgi:hypothetical protein